MVTTRWKWLRSSMRRVEPSLGSDWCWRFSRIATPAPRDCFEDFVKVLSRADAVVLTEVYAAGEKPHRGGRWPSLDPCRARGRQVEPILSTTSTSCRKPWLTSPRWRCGDFMGAGSIEVPAEVVELLKD